MNRHWVSRVSAGAAALCVAAAHGALQRFPDPTTETAFPEQDLVELNAEVVGGELQVSLRYSGALGLADGNHGTLFIDGDLDPDTGGHLGTEAVVDFVFTGVYTGGSVLVGDRVIGLGQQGTVVKAGSDTISLSLPLALWSGQVPPRLFATSAESIATTLYDRVPDAGWLEVASGLAVLPRPGNQQVQVMFADSTQDALWPDMTRFEMRVADGNLLMWLTFANGVEKRHLQEIQDTLVINLSFDTDRRLWTGFRNNHEVPPTFGIDRQIQILLSHLFTRPDAVLRWQRPADAQNPTAELVGELEGIGLGDQHFDTRCVVGANAEFGTAQNQIFLSIPLYYFGYCDTEMFVMIDALLEATLTPGHADSLPDQGALNTSVGLTPEQRIQPLASCTQPESVQSDLTDDSLWAGYQGDEIIQTRACPLTDGGLAIRVDLEQLEYSDMAFANVFVDSDGLVNTGMPVANNSLERMGADLCVSCQFSRAPEPTIVSALYMDLRQTPFWPGPLRVAHLVSARAGGVFGSQTPGGFYVFNLPSEILSSGPGQVSRYLVTTTRQAYSATDQTRYLDKLDDQEDPDVKRSGIIHITPTGKSAIVDSAPNVGFCTVASPPALPLQVLGIRPQRGSNAGGTPVMFAGHGFAPDAEVRFADQLVPADETRFLSSGDLSAISPAGSPGSVSVSVRNPQTDQSTVVPAAFIYGAPLVLPPITLKAEPSLGPLEGGNTIEIRGANFVDGAQVRIGATPVLSTQRDSAFQLTVQVPPGEIGPAAIEVTNPDGASGTLPEGYNYGARPPEVWAWVPRFGAPAGGTPMTIVGQGFEPGVAVSLGGQPLSQLQFESAQVLTGTTPPTGAPGPVDLTVTNPNGVRRQVVAAFHYGQPDPLWPAPTLLGVTPMSSPTDGGVAVRILGTGFGSGAAVFFDRTPAPVAYFDPNLIETTRPPHVSGVVPLLVVNPDGKTAELPADQGWNSFTYDSNDPWLSLVNPMSSPTTGGEEITLFGSNFRPGAKVEFGGIAAVAVDIGETIIFAKTPPHTPGPVAIKVTNPGGLSTLYEGDTIFGQFEYIGPVPGTPSVSNVVPAEGSVLGGGEVRLEGANLYAGVRIFFDGNEAVPIGQSLADSVTVGLPAGSAGAADIEVRNADGGTLTLPGVFDYVAPQPTLTSLTPTHGAVTGGTPVELTGTDFLPDAAVTFADLSATAARWIDPLTLLWYPRLPVFRE